MTDHLPRLARGAGVTAVLLALAALANVGRPARLPVTPDPYQSAWVVPPTVPRASVGQPAQPVFPRATRTASPRPTLTALPRSKPVRVSIPAIDAASSLMPLGLNPDRTVQVPPLSDPMQAGWYSLGPTPGEVGASVILGHVDGYSEPGIFFRLRDVRPGDRILVTREDGTTVRFMVYRTEQVPKDDFPTEKVYRAAARPELRLITCGGSFDSQSGNYRDNVLVFAVFAGPN
ncbi:class F sortase [Planosporangium flavigriseum]|uniref:Class F sortase n=1 Tax=Planosporangium flavigriseum TaxID=373681 RepID=A0A8J3LZT2_9ACTN|nr:class F sortase [Planosporangium flavigriseum]NJC64690.1 class F sortase [Planosporangium flavigriseum]GIG74085.1 hypothetical protein Pfl04_24890 [Planosporangium flavigriseum]